MCWHACLDGTPAKCRALLSKIKDGQTMFHPCSIIFMNIIVGFLTHGQSLSTNESDMRMQSIRIQDPGTRGKHETKKKISWCT